MREPSPPGRLGELGQYDRVYALCCDCGRWVRLDVAQLAERIGAGATLAELRGRLVCSGGRGRGPCGSHAVTLTLIWQGAGFVEYRRPTRRPGR